MAQPATWIRKNMLYNSNGGSIKSDIDNKQNNNRRPLTEAEIRVQRSLEKLSIPAWYLNNSSKPPKILMHDSPIDTRLSPWKTASPKPKNVSSSPILNKRKLSVDSSPRKTPTIDRKPEENKPKQIINRMDTWQIQSPAKIPVTYTQSYPKISPSRKIKNINIVFSPSFIKDSEKINESDLIVENSLYETSFNDSVLEKSVRVTDLDKAYESLMDQSFNVTNEFSMNSLTRFNNSNLYKKLNVALAPLVKEKVKISYTPIYPPAKITSIDNSNTTQSEHQSSITSFDSTGEIYNDWNEFSNNNQSGSPLRLQSKNNKSYNKLMSIDENKEINQRIRPTSITTTNEFMTTKKKSTALEQIVKQKMNGGTGLIQELIEEFQKKCKTSPNKTYTRGSKKFVKKLVKVLENSINEDYNESDMDGNSEKELYNIPKSNNNNKFDDINLDNKSVTSLATMSLKDLDSVSDESNEPSSPFSSTNSYDDWIAQSRIAAKNAINKSARNGRGKVDWIPLPFNVDLPRTSSVLSMKSARSRPSSRLSSNKSPCISPITEDGTTPHIFRTNRDYWSWSYGKDNTKTSRFGREKSNAIFDSGYADKTEHSFMIQSFLAEYEASRSFRNFDTSKNSRLSFDRASSTFTRPLHV